MNRQHYQSYLAMFMKMLPPGIFDSKTFLYRFCSKWDQWLGQIVTNKHTANANQTTFDLSRWNTLSPLICLIKSTLPKHGCLSIDCQSSMYQVTDKPVYTAHRNYYTTLINTDGFADTFQVINLLFHPSSHSFDVQIRQLHRTNNAL